MPNVLFGLLRKFFTKHTTRMKPLFFALISLFSSTSLTAQLHLELVGHLPYEPLSLAGCWHHVDSAGGEWALVGTSAGLSIVDLSQPSQPKERFAVPSLPNNWREVKTWGGFAYFGSEAQRSGITIVDLRELPDTVRWKTWLGDGAYDSLVVRSHAVQAEDGYLYIFGGGDVTNGATIADLKDPWNPHIVGKYTLRYVHDGFIRGDTLWASEIFDGQFSVVDISDKTDPKFIAAQPTPARFNHNSGLSDDSRTLFTTDERIKAPLASFDVTDLDAPRLLDLYWPSQRPSGEVHNVRVINDFLVNPSYSGQLTIVDAHRPDNLIETAWALMGSSLVWDADPYLPSGLVFATAKTEGLFIFKPTYQRAAYLEGRVTDAVTGLPLLNAGVTLIGAPKRDSTGLDGTYKTGSALPGTYTVEAGRAGYETKILTGVTLKTAEVTLLDIALQPLPSSTGDLTDAANSLRVSPSVFDDFLTITAPAEGMLRISDAQGRALRTAQTAGGTATFSGFAEWPSGTYVVTFEGKNGARVVRQVVKR